MNLYVGNLSFNTGEADLREAFSAYGTVSDARVVNDRETGRPRGFGFVEMSGDAEGRAAVNGLNGKDLGGRTITVNEARPREERGGSRGGGGGGGGYNSRY